MAKIPFLNRIERTQIFSNIKTIKMAIQKLSRCVVLSTLPSWALDVDDMFHRTFTHSRIYATLEESVNNASRKPSCKKHQLLSQGKTICSVNSKRKRFLENRHGLLKNQEKKAKHLKIKLLLSLHAQLLLSRIHIQKVFRDDLDLIKEKSKCIKRSCS